jgi:urease accessory protein
VNKTDLAPLVGADLELMARDAAAQRDDLPTVFVSLREDPTAGPVADWVRSEIGA